MTLHDITLTLSERQPPWPGDTPYLRAPKSQIALGDVCNISTLTLSTHIGTHLDAPYHFIDDGIRVDALDLESLVGPALVHEIDPTETLIKPEHLPDLNGITRILFKTSNSSFIDDTEFHTEYTSVSPEAAKAMTDAGIKLVGIDYFSVEAYESPGHPVHKELCGKGVILVEGLDLRKIRPGRYDLTVLPLKLKNADGSPCRAILRSE